MGDLLARIVKDDKDPTETDTVNANSAILKRAIKIAHIDLREPLGIAYGMLTMFPSSRPAHASSSGNSDQIGFATSPRVFTKDLSQSDLPHAAFPSLKIQGLNSAAFGVSAGGGRSANFGASNEGVEEIHLTDVRTYGLPSARAFEALQAYCNNEKTRNDC